MFAEKLGGGFLFLKWLCQPRSCSENQLLFSLWEWRWFRWFGPNQMWKIKAAAVHSSFSRDTMSECFILSDSSPNTSHTVNTCPADSCWWTSKDAGMSRLHNVGHRGRTFGTSGTWVRTCSCWHLGLISWSLFLLDLNLTTRSQLLRTSYSSNWEVWFYIDFYVSREEEKSRVVNLSRCLEPRTAEQRFHESAQ